MDNLTHSLVGALLGQMGLKRKTGLAMPTLIIAANIPDIDAVAVLLGGHQHLALRRSLTHGPIAMVLLPLMLWGAMLWFDRWQTRRGKRPAKRLPIHKGWLLALAYIGCLGHPLFDWFNSYGIRLLEPFSSQWFYGDTLFIIDIWIWAALIAGVWFSLRREKYAAANWQRPAWISFIAVCGYIFVNGAITGMAEADMLAMLRAQNEPTASIPDPMVVANPVPVEFWKREILWRDNKYYGQGKYSLIGGLRLDQNINLIGTPDVKLIKSLENWPDIKNFLFWSRMPIFKSVLGSGKAASGQVTITDQRFAGSLASENFTVEASWSDE